MTSRLSPETVFDVLHSTRKFVLEYQDMLIENAQFESKGSIYKGLVLPPGWRYLGSGVYRDAFLGPDGWVYKIGSQRSNFAEVMNSERFYLESDSSIVFPYAEPVCEYLIIRCEYIDGYEPDEDVISWDCKEDGLCCLTCYIENVSNHRLRDVHPGNIRILEEGTPVMIDLG